jgi:CheY-like chemotaxis protein
VFREMLEGLGFAVAEAASGAAALTAAAGRPFDLAIVDLRMPSMSGLELARRLRSIHPGTKLLATSASTFDFGRDEVRDAGADEFLPKPFQEAQLTAILERLLDLDWRHGPAEEPAPPEPRGRPAGAASAEDLAPLREAADRGDIAALRQALAALRARRSDLAAFVAEIEALASAYRMDAIRRRLGPTPPAH